MSDYQKRGFVRALWGIHDNTQRHFKHRGKINNDIKLVAYNKYMPPYTTFVFGEDNHKQLLDSGFQNCILADKRPIVWDMNKEQFRHKLEVLKLGSQLFDEMVYTDIDTMPVKPIPDNFWNVLAQKKSIQAILRMYHRKKCFWRHKDPRKVPCAAFIYIGDKAIPEELIATWEKMGRPWSEEVALMKYIDDISGGWKDEKYYWDNFEPVFFNLLCNTAYGHKEMVKAKDVCFEHFNHRVVSALLRQISKKQKTIYDCFNE